MSERVRGHLIYLALLVFAVAVQVVVAYLVPTNLSQPIGVRDDRGYIDGFHPREYSDFYQTGYRWSKPQAMISLPGLGGNARFRVELVTFGGPPELLGRKVELSVNGRPAASFITAADWQTQTVEIATDWWGDARLQINAQEGHAPGDSRPLGILLRDVRVVSLAAGGPALSQLVAALLISVALYLLLALLGLNRAVCGVVGALAGLGFTFALLGPRLILASWSYGLVFAAVGALTLVVGLRFIFRRRSGKDDWLFAGAQQALPAIVALAFMLRVAGPTYPQAYVIDTPIHLQDVSAILDGHLDALWRPRSGALHNGVNAADLVIPYPPLFALAVSPLLALPLPWPQGRTLQGFTALLDATAVLLIFMLARRARLARRAALLACLLYAIAPVMLLAFIWGVGPTLFGSWATLLALALWAFLPAGRRTLLVLALACGLALLAYVFNALYVPILAVGLLLVLLPRAPAWGGRLLAALALGAALDFALYYWQFVGPTLARTLPSLANSAGGGTALSRTDADLSSLVALIGREWPLPFFAAIIIGGVLALLPRKHSSADARRAAALRAGLVFGGLLVFIIPTLIEQKIYIQHKHVFFAAPYLAFAGALAFSAWSRRGPAGRAFVLTGLATLACAAFLFYQDQILYGSPLFP